MSHDDCNTLEHRLTNAECELDDAYEGVAAEIGRHAALKTLPTHADMERWARAIVCAKADVAAAEKAMDARALCEQRASWTLQ